MNSAKLIHTTATGREELQLPLKKMLSAKKPDVDLKPDDIILVASAWTTKLPSAASRAFWRSARA